MTISTSLTSANAKASVSASKKPKSLHEYVECDAELEAMPSVDAESSSQFWDVGVDGKAKLLFDELLNDGDRDILVVFNVSS